MSNLFVFVFAKLHTYIKCRKAIVRKGESIMKETITEYFELAVIAVVSIAAFVGVKTMFMYILALV